MAIICYVLKVLICLIYILYDALILVSILYGILFACYVILWITCLSVCPLPFRLC